jgi:hypothetical protein
MPFVFRSDTVHMYIDEIGGVVLTVYFKYDHILKFIQKKLHANKKYAYK